MTIRPAPVDNPPDPSCEAVPRALVAFSGQTELRWLRLFRPGFRHCFVLVESRVSGTPVWVLYNPLSVGTQLALWPGSDVQDLKGWLRREGYTVVETHASPIRQRLFAWRPYTCVEAVKRVLGVHESRVWTPWQLYCYLKIVDKQKIILDYGE